MAHPSDENTFKVLLATDIHLGYAENVSNRENDTFITFEEILDIATKEKVDFILLGGDLFHETKPSPFCINKCIELIRKYCLGDKSVEIEILSDPSINFPRNASVNYEDPNMNIAIPIFSIHGNHDDPTGKKHISALDLLASIGLVNYFGRWDNVENVEINPVLLKKGNSHLALYGLSHIRDERLARLFDHKKVKFKVPGNVNDWFNMFILHQNRAKNRGIKNFIPETAIPEFIDLVMWGHEHDCHIEPSVTLTGKTYITQPGSSVATSLTEGESIRKAVGLLRVSGSDDFNLQTIELQTVRPFIHKTVILNRPPAVVDELSLAERARLQIRAEVETMIKEAKRTRKTNMNPLLRIKASYHDERQVFNGIRFGQEFADRVANPEDIIKFAPLHKRSRLPGFDLEIDDTEIDQDTVHRVEDLMLKYFDENNKLEALNIEALNEAVMKCIDSRDFEAPLFMIQLQQKELLKKLMEVQPKVDDISDCLMRIQSIRTMDEYREILNDPNRPKPVTDVNDELNIDDDSDDSSVRPSKGPGSRGGRGSRGGKGSRRSRGRAK